MRAMVIDEWGDADSIHAADVDPPPVAPDGVLVRVRAAGVNPVDTKIRAGYMAEALPFHFPLVLGWDVAGVVEQVGPAVTDFRPGDEVYGYIRRHHLQYGTYAELATAPEEFFAHKPKTLSFEQAAGLPLAVLTAHQALEVMGVRGGESLFVCGGSGGVGHLAIQLGVTRGARVVATASERNLGFLRELGAEPVDYTSGDVASRVREIFPEEGADAALDLFGGDQREQAFESLRRGGRLVSVARPPPEPREGYEVRYVYVRPSGEELREIADLADAGRLRPEIEETFPLEQAAEAHRRIETGRVRGKLVLSVSVSVA